MEVVNIMLPVDQKLSKAGIKALAEKKIEEVLENGHVEKMAVTLKAFEELVKAIRGDKRFIEYMREEAAKNGGKLVTEAYTIENCETGVSYEYSHDEQWRKMDEAIKEIQELKTQREKILRSVAPGKAVTDTETGEVLYVGAAKKSTSNYKCELK